MALSEQMYRLIGLARSRQRLQMPRPRKPASPFGCFNSSPEIIHLVVVKYVRFPLPLRNIDDLLFGWYIDIS